MLAQASTLSLLVTALPVRAGLLLSDRPRSRWLLLSQAPPRLSQALVASREGIDLQELLPRHCHCHCHCHAERLAVFLPSQRHTLGISTVASLSPASARSTPGALSGGRSGFADSGHVALIYNEAGLAAG